MKKNEAAKETDNMKWEMVQLQIGWLSKTSLRISAKTWGGGIG